jgi:hypothetical protein
MAWLQSLLVKLIQSLALKLAAYLRAIYKLKEGIKKDNRKIDGQADAVNKVVNDVKSKGAISDEQEKALREATRNLINGTFDN